MSLLDRAGGAGAITSRIDHQDGVAVFVALSFLAGQAMFGISVKEPDGVVLHCEGRDDLELVTPQARCLISVKAQPGGLKLIADEYVRLSGRQYNDDSREKSSALFLVGPQPQQIVTFSEQLESARSLLAHRGRAEAEEVYTEFHRRWPDICVAAIDDFYLVLGTPRLHTNEYIALAVQLLRKIAPVTDYTDERVLLLVSDFNSKLAKARLARGSVTLTEIRDAIIGFAMPLETVTVANAYVQTAYGYLRHPGIMDLLKRESRDVKTAIRYAMRRYRKATRLWLLFALLAPIRCIACNRALTANLYGWTRRGIACGHCEFSPFVSFFYACICGHPVLLVAQPPVDLVDMAVSLRRALETNRCEHCNQRPKPERLQTRVFQLNIPWPPENFSDVALIEARKELGWNSKGFRDGKISAQDALLTEALVGRVERRLPPVK